MSMDGAQHREIACAIIIDTCERFLLQQRDDVPGIVCPGMVGLFGGHREGNETFLQCVVREVHEETSYFVAPERFAPLASYNGPDPDGGYGSLRGEFFVARGIPANALLITEGSLLIAAQNELFRLPPLSAATKFALDAFFASQSRT
jgi:8-oxo-dGTP pyrophosphatase MutT (NUDIX family)